MTTRHRNPPVRFINDDELFRILDRPKSIDHIGVMTQWMSLVEDFSNRRLTYLADRLPAIAGLATIIAHVAPEVGKYLAGLWSCKLRRQLFWYPISSRTENSADASLPSWSWISHQGGISFSLADDLGRRLGFTGVKTRDIVISNDTFECESSNVVPQKQSPFGAFSGSERLIYSKFFERKSLSKATPDPKIREYRHIWVRFDNPMENDNERILYLDKQNDYGSHKKTWRFLYLFQCFVKHDSFGVHCGLVLKARLNDTFERIGTFSQLSDEKPIMETEIKLGYTRLV